MTVQTVQQTGKFWKLLMLVATAICIWGIVQVVQGVNHPDFGKIPADGSLESHDLTLGYGMIKLTGGMIIAIFSRIGAWWFHG